MTVEGRKIIKNDKKLYLFLHASICENTGVSHIDSSLNTVWKNGSSASRCSRDSSLNTSCLSTSTSSSSCVGCVICSLLLQADHIITDGSVSCIAPIFATLHRPAPFFGLRFCFPPDLQIKTQLFCLP
jgi:hypothetical protein